MNATTENFNYLKYSSSNGKDFDSILKKRVRLYFKEQKISKYATTGMKIKTAFMLFLYFTPYLLVLLNVVTSPGLITLCYILTGFGLAGIGMCVFHDANHDTYSKKPIVNYILGRIGILIGAYVPTWKIQHNVLHHTYTNIQDFDEDVSPPINVLRFTPNDTYRPIHRFQYIYAWFFYSLMTLLRMTTKDFKQILRYKKLGLTKGLNYNHLMIELVVSKLIYYVYMVVLPILLIDIPWWSVFLLLLLKHMIAGLTLSVIFILAHVVPEATFPEPTDDFRIENNWARHQLETTSNFAPKSRIFSWFIGGLNYQIEHHLFPNICHVHYKNISPIVRQTAKEFNITYHCERTFFSAVRSHKRMLQRLGEPSSENLDMALNK